MPLPIYPDGNKVRVGRAPAHAIALLANFQWFKLLFCHMKTILEAENTMLV